MYTIVAVVDGKEYPIYNMKSRRLIVSDPYFEIGDNLNGQAEFKVHASHPYYSKVRKLTTDIIIRNDDKAEFYGRVLYDDEDSNGTKQVFVEGELAFLCDSIQPPREYHNIGVRDYLTNIITIHNDQVEARKRFTVGRVTVQDANDSLYRYSNWENTRETLKDKLSDRLGGHFVIRRENGIRYLDYLSDDDYYSRCAQPIEFGKNLLSFARNFDATDLATCIIPLGCRLEESSIEALEERLTIKDVNNGIYYVTDDAAVANYGKIYKTIIFDDITLPENLKKKGQKYLTQTQYEKMVLECTAIDLRYTSTEFERFELGSLVHCVSKPHALDAWYQVTKQKFYLTDFKKNTITLGDESDNVSYTSSNRQTTATFREDLETYRTGLTERIKKANYDFKEAIDNANGLYSTEVKQENGSVVTYYHNKKDLESSSIRLVFNDSGFAVSNNAGENWYGIQVDGKFIADILYAYGVNAGWINTGTLRVTDAKGKEVMYVDVDTGVVRIVASEFSLSNGDTIGSIAKKEADAAVDGQTQSDIFNKLTNNGKTQGVYLKDGLLYVNGTFMKIGKISSKNGRVYFDLDNNEIVCSKLKASRPWEATSFDPGDVIIDISKKESSYSSLNVSYANIYKDGNEENGLRIVPPKSGSGQSASPNRGIKIFNRNTENITISCGAGDVGTSTASSTLLLGASGFDLMAIVQSTGASYGISANSSTKIVSVYGTLSGQMANFTGLQVTGSKSRIVDTKNYAKRLLYCYEMPSPMFGDIGEAETDESGECYIYLDDIFSETVTANIEYQVFLQEEGQGKVWIAEKNQVYFVVKGTEKLKFAWEIKAKQRGYEFERLERTESEEESNEIDYEAEYLQEINQLMIRQEDILYDTTA